MTSRFTASRTGTSRHTFLRMLVDRLSQRPLSRPSHQSPQQRLAFPERLQDRQVRGPYRQVSHFGHPRTTAQCTLRLWIRPTPMEQSTCAPNLQPVCIEIGVLPTQPLGANQWLARDSTQLESSKGVERFRVST